MRTKTKISLRIDDDLLKVLKNNSTGNLTAYIEDLLLKGLITDLADVNQQIKFGKDFKNFVNNTRDEFEEQMKTSAIFLQEVIFKIALKHGFEEKELRKLYQVIKLQNSKNKKYQSRQYQWLKLSDYHSEIFHEVFFRQRQQTLPFFFAFLSVTRR